MDASAGRRLAIGLLDAAEFPDAADDVATHYAGQFAASCEGEAAFLASVMAPGSCDAAIRATLARALRMAATRLEARP